MTIVSLNLFECDFLTIDEDALKSKCSSKSDKNIFVHTKLRNGYSTYTFFIQIRFRQF